MSSLHLEIPEDQRVALDVSRLRVLARYLRIQTQDGRVEVDAADLDTGSALAVIAPLADVSALLEGGETWADHIETSAGRVPTTVVQVQLHIGHWIIDGVELHAMEHPTRWLIGMPVLRHFDLLLRDQRLEGSWLAGPTPGIIQVGGAA